MRTYKKTGTKNGGRSARRWLAIGSIILGTLVFAAYASGAPAERAKTGPATTSKVSAGFTFTDDRGVTITLDKRPTRIVAYETPAAALWYVGIKPVAIFGSVSLEDSPLLDGVDVRGIQSLGKVYGEINLEKLAALKPDLIVTAYNPKFKPLWGFKDEKLEKKMGAFAPIVAINGVKSPTQVIARFRALGVALGADIKSPAQVKVKRDFDASVKALRSAAKSKPGLKVLAIANYSGDEIFFAKPKDFPELRQYQSWGVKLVVPGGKDDYYDTASWEQADKYPADLILYDTRAGGVDLKQLNKKPTWRALPAVKAGQIVAWQGQEDWSYQLYTRDIKKLTAAIRKANPNLVP